MEAKVTLFSSKKTLNLGGKLRDLSQPLVMGILNSTPDSFYDGGHYNRPGDLQRRIEILQAEGADIIDIGGYSSRPGALDIDLKEEQKRVLDALSAVQEVAPELPVSIDTFRSEIAQAALDQGAHMINDISGGNLDPQMIEVIAKWKVPYVMMHMKGTPQTMTTQTKYQDLVPDVFSYFVQGINNLRAQGVKDIILDPGFGFAKTVPQNYVLLKNLDYFKVLNCPLLVGLSRKSMIYKPLNTTADQALNGTSVLNTIALMNGASILRVHDVKAAKEAITFFKLTYS